VAPCQARGARCTSKQRATTTAAPTRTAGTRLYWLCCCLPRPSAHRHRQPARHACARTHPRAVARTYPSLCHMARLGTWAHAGSAGRRPPPDFLASLAQKLCEAHPRACPCTPICERHFRTPRSLLLALGPARLAAQPSLVAAFLLPRLASFIPSDLVVSLASPRASPTLAMRHEAPCARQHVITLPSMCAKRASASLLFGLFLSFSLARFLSLAFSLSRALPPSLPCEPRTRAAHKACANA